MKILNTKKELEEYRKSLKGKIGLVPTMGALHSGHLSLIQKSKKENDFTIVSVFVNPTQFLENEDFSKYPKKTEADLKICSLAKVDCIFMPEANEMYSKDEVSLKAPSLGYILEGFYRPGHFDGVLTVVLKLFNLTNPTNAYFGKKDTQQFFILQNMVKSLFLSINLIPCDIVRDKDGLALSSRNAYLDENQRKEALKISRSLKIASDFIIKKEFKTEKIKEEMLKILEPLKVDYVAFVDRKFQEIEEIEISNTIILVAVRVGKTRLIDNIWV